MSDDDTELEQLKERRDLVAALSAEVDRQRVDHAGRASAMTTRLSILVAAASVTGGLQLSDTTHVTVPYVIGVFLASLAALAGMVGLWPLSGSENGVEDIQNELWNHPKDRALYIFMHRRLEILKDEERVLVFRAWVSRIGFGALALSVVFIAIHLTRLL